MQTWSEISFVLCLCWESQYCVWSYGSCSPSHGEWEGRGTAPALLGAVRAGCSRLSLTYPTGTGFPAKQVHDVQAIDFSEGLDSFCGSLGSFYVFLGEIHLIIYVLQGVSYSYTFRWILPFLNYWGTELTNSMLLFFFFNQLPKFFKKKNNSWKTAFPW